MGYDSEFFEVHWELKHFKILLLNSKAMCFPYCLIPNFKVLGASFLTDRETGFNIPRMMLSNIILR